MESLPEDGRLLLFADLRPSSVYSFGGHEVVALVLHETPTMIVHVPMDGGSAVLPDGRHIHPVEVIDTELSVFGEGEPGLSHFLLHLDVAALVVDDWALPNLEAMDDVRASFPAATWEELPSDHADALVRINERLSNPPLLA